MRDDALIIAQDQYYSMDPFETKLNNNVLVVGASGSGKTRSIVTPNLLQASGSYIISKVRWHRHRDFLQKVWEISDQQGLHSKEA